jgi:hypothetical protein
MTTILTLLTLLFIPPHTTGTATRFGTPGDRYGSSPTLCTGRRVTAKTWGIATRRGQCGDRYLVQAVRTGRWVIVPRIDSGPWFAVPRWCLATYGRETYCRSRFGTVLTRKRPGYTWGSNVVDLTPGVDLALGCGGWCRIRMWRMQ